jgi:hypothetical protein
MQNCTPDPEHIIDVNASGTRLQAASMAMISVTEVKHNCDIFMCVDVGVVGHYSVANSFAFEMKHKFSV